MDMKLLDIVDNGDIDNSLDEQSRANLYHALEFEYAVSALKKNKLDAYTFQRYWPDGKRRKDNDTDYYQSHYYRGLSLTRNIRYAVKWNDVVFVFNQNKLSSKYKIIPYNWSYSLSVRDIKRETEEFLVVSKIDKPIPDNVKLIKKLQKPGGKVYPLDKYLIGFYINNRIYDIVTKNGTKSNTTIDFLQKHPLYLGLK